MAAHTRARRIASWAVLTALLACSDSTGPSPEPPTVTIDRIELSAPATRLEVGATVPVTLTARSAAGQVVAVQEVAWSSSDTVVATVTGAGLVSARAVGAATIRAVAAGRTGELPITVVPVPVASVTVVPDTATVEVGGRRTLAAVARGADGRELAGRTLRWSSADTLVAAVLPDGTVEGRAPGAVVVTAQVDSARGTARVTVIPARVASVAVTPDTVTLVEGSTRQLTALARSASGAELTGRPVRWSSGNEAVAAVGADGTVEARAAGTATITAQVDSVRGTATVTVRPAPVATLSVVPDTVRLTVGSTRQLVAVARSAEGKVLTGRAVRWSSGNERVATVSPEGIVAGADVGAATVTAEVEGIRATAAVTVASIPLPTLGVEEIPVSFIPVHLAAPPGDSRLYVAGLHGTIHVVQGGRVQPEPFLDLTDRVSQEDLLGLYTIAFHPRFAENGYVYVDYTDRSGVQRI
ncbi:MAG: Ig-like domain-containing protein, partial [Gemmatimonadetes bacterium]|nr:Ig-like domain-containing protein [Gemmatimonadota bacterium]